MANYLSRSLLVVVFITEAFAQNAINTPGLTLAKAIEQALQNNLQTNLAGERTRESRAQRGIGLSALLPNISGVAYQMNLTENLAAQGLTSATFPGIPAFIGPYNRFDARFAMTQSLFNLASIRRYQALRHGVELADAGRRLTEQQVITATTLSYIAVLEAGESVSAADANVQLAQRLLELAEHQRNAGLATGLDVARAETRLASQQVQLAQAQTNLDTAKLNLLRVTGAPLSAQVALAESMRFSPQPPPATGEAIQKALGGRLELRVASEQVRIAKAEYGAALGGWVPSVSVFGDYGSSGLKPDQVDLATRSIGIRVDVPIFDGGRTKAEQQAAASRVQPGRDAVDGSSHRRREGRATSARQSGNSRRANARGAEKPGSGWARAFARSGPLSKRCRR